MAAPAVTGATGGDAGHAPPSPEARAARRPRRLLDPGTRGGAASLLAFLPVGFLLVFGGIPVVLSLLLMLGHLGGPNSAISELGQNEIRSHGIVTFGAITQVLEDPAFQRNVVATVEVFLITSALALGIAVTLTFWYRLRPSGPLGALQVLSVIPLFIPVVIASFSLWTFWGSRGFSNSLAALLGWSNGLVFTGRLSGVVLAETWVSIPFAVLLMRAGVASLGGSSLDAARDAGAGPFTIAWRIMLPQLRRECTVVFCFTAVGALGSFTVPYIVGPSAPLMLGVDAANTFQSYNEPQQAAVLGFCIFVLALLIGALYAVGSRKPTSRKRGAGAR